MNRLTKFNCQFQTRRMRFRKCTVNRRQSTDPKGNTRLIFRICLCVVCTVVEYLLKKYINTNGLYDTFYRQISRRINRLNLSSSGNLWRGNCFLHSFSITIETVPADFFLGFFAFRLSLCVWNTNWLHAHDTTLTKNRRL